MASGDWIIRGFTTTPEVEPFIPQKLVVEHNTCPTQLSLSDNLETLADLTAYAATVTLEDANGNPEIVKAKYVLGCDGAHSWTQLQLGIHMVGENCNDVWGLIDGYIDLDFPDLRTLSVIENDSIEHNMVRFTVQIDRSEVTVDPETGRIDRIQIKVETIQRVEFYHLPDVHCY
ncbi:hypothetical protein FRC10_010671 [Ceratobasidium sp. 414]|nr:hypothetical protein FRC10_010671 [Ceratobasidium sp. 414]